MFNQAILSVKMYGLAHKRKKVDIILPGENKAKLSGIKFSVNSQFV